ncbi:MAG: phosphoadenylyl-sulfate reductase [Acetobacteraceae bacterium]
MQVDHIDLALRPDVAGDDLSTLNAVAAGLTLEQRLGRIRGTVRGRLVFTTSFGAEDQLITDALVDSRIEAELVTIDTGRLFPETYDVWAATERRYGRRIAALTPEAGPLADLVVRIGINGFYDGPDRRHDCCGVRKVAPLGRALAGAAGWITGLRGEQSDHRGGVAFAERDPARGLLKCNPLFDWSRTRLMQALADRGVPINSLHASGFASIGCAPCTRALRPGEPERAGRWWWEADQRRECGLHLAPDGRPTRQEHTP